MSTIVPAISLHLKLFLKQRYNLMGKKWVDMLRKNGLIHYQVGGNGLEICLFRVFFTHFHPIFTEIG
jgi:hypothetical protein